MLRLCAFCLVASATARLSASSGVLHPPGRRRILMLVSDTGGGHRASANALDQMMQELRADEADTDVKIVDIWTDYAAFPYNKMAAGYPWLCKHPWAWRYMYFASIFLEVPAAVDMRLRCGAKFRQCIQEYDPDLVVSLHPLCQHLPLTILKSLGRRGDKGDGGRRTPFAVVCTDLGGAHPAWFKPEVDACFVPSDAVRRVAKKRGVDDSKIFQHGLPVRADFWRASAAHKKVAQERYDELGLAPHRKTVLIAGGGDGVGSLSKIVDATAERLASDCPGEAQVVALCGKNAKVRAEIEARAASGAWSGVEVAARGFTSEISAYMEVADCLVTKAGPGTIAEACCCGLPIMISGYLPGQETGNVDFVVNGGFGDYSSKPERIAATVSSWLEDDRLLQQMSERSLAASRPGATDAIADDIATLVQSTDGAAPAPGAYRARARALGMMSPLSASASAPSDSHRGRAPAPRPLGHSDVPRQPTPTPAEFASAGI